MQKFKSFIKEHVVTIGLDPRQEHHREKLRHQIHDVLHKSYSEVDGYSGLGSGSKAESEAIHSDITNSVIKATVRNGSVTHATLYKPSHGRKIIAVGTNKSEQGTKDFNKNAEEDHKFKRAWGEFSHRAEKAYRKKGFPQVASSRAGSLTGKVVDPTDEHRYNRSIGGKVLNKTILGHPKD